MGQMQSFLVAQGEPAGGASAAEILWGSVGACVIFGFLALVAVAHRSGRTRALTNLGAFAGKTLGLPPWAALPAAVAGGALLMAAFGFYWDVATHIDNGRDPGPFANPSHYLIIFGLLGIALAGLFGILLGTDEETRTSVRIRAGWNAPVGSILLVVCGMIAVAGFPLDDIWHRLFGQDVTLWGPTHIQMVGGAALSTLALWVVFTEGARAAGSDPVPSGVLRFLQISIAGAFLIGLSALQAEFDYSVPQFRLLFHPVLLALSAATALVPARIRIGRGGALGAVAFFLVVRSILSAIIGPGLDHTMLRFPLYLVEALLIEAIALRVSPRRQLTFGLWCGAAIGTVGVAAEFAWSHLWMTMPWPLALFPEIGLALVAGLGGGLLGGLIGRALSEPGVERERSGRLIVATTALAIMAALVIPLPISGDARGTATVILDDPEADRTAITVTLDPPTLANDPLWFNVTAWQGGGSVVSDLRPTGEGTYRSGSVPISGDWKSLIRLHAGDSIVAVPVYLPEDPAIPAEGVPAETRSTRDFVMDKQILLREAKDTEPWLSWVGYTVLGLIVLVWISVLAWGLMRMDKTERLVQRGPRLASRVPRTIT
jgi:hypothetical protein